MTRHIPIVAAPLLLFGALTMPVHAAERSFTLVSGAEVGFEDGRAYFTAGNGHHGFFGKGGDIDGESDPTLKVRQGDKVTVTLLDLDE